MLRNRGYKYIQLNSFEDNIELLEKHLPNNLINSDPVIIIPSAPPEFDIIKSSKYIHKKDIIDESYEKPKQIIEILTDKKNLHKKDIINEPYEKPKQIIEILTDKKILETEPEYDFEVIECIFTKDNPANFHTIEIKCINTMLFIKNNEIISTYLF